MSKLSSNVCLFVAYKKWETALLATRKLNKPTGAPARKNTPQRQKKPDQGKENDYVTSL